MSLQIPRTLDRPRTFNFGGPSTESAEERRRREESNRKKWDERTVDQFYIGDKKPAPHIPPTGKIVKEKTKTKKSAGVSQQVTVPDHQEKLTKHGKKTIIVETKEEDKPEPHVQPRREIDYVREKRKGAPPPPKRSILRKRPLESGPVPKRQRRVSAHQV